MAASREKLNKLYEKEMEMVLKYEEVVKKHKEILELHKKKAADYKRQIDIEDGMRLQNVINQHNLSGKEYEMLLKLLKDHTAIEDAIRRISEKEEKSNQ